MANLSGLIETIMFSLLLVVLVGVFLGYMNEQYDEEYTTGLDTSSLSSFFTSTQSAYDETGGEVTQTNDGLTLLSSWKMVMAIAGTTYDFITGQWISNLMTDVLMIDDQAGWYISLVLRSLFILIIVWTIIKLFFKVVA